MFLLKYLVSAVILLPLTSTNTNTSTTEEKNIHRPARTWTPSILPKPVPPGSDILYSGEVLQQGQMLVSGDGRFRFILQYDGNLVLYYHPTGTPIWATDTINPDINLLRMLSGGNLVLYDSNNTAWWLTYTYGYPGAYVIVQNDGNVVMYHNGTPIWDTGTCCY